MTNEPLLLVDLQDGFVILTECKNIKIDYGLYSMMICSVIGEEIIATFNDESFFDVIGEIKELCSSVQYMEINSTGFDKKEEYADLMRKIASLLSMPLFDLLNTGHLNEEQLTVVTKLFVAEFTKHLCSPYSKFEDKSTYVPSALQNADFRTHLRSLMLRKMEGTSSILQREMDNLKLTATVTMVQGVPYTVYHVTNTLEFLLVDLQKYLTGKRTVKECLYCKKLFFPICRSTVDYCPLPYKTTGKSCYYIKRHTPKDELEGVYIKAKRQQAKKRDYSMNTVKYGMTVLAEIYEDWKKECDIEYAKARRTGDIMAFKEWVEETKFLKQRLEELVQLKGKKG
ncbi:MAG: hypothetical protein IJZ55_08415 [Lachnospiraceae bacterium]|nr:hypothetical protein [Lachnospiraceae bacterium]